MSSNTIHAILFDADGVIVSPMMQFSRHLTQVYGITPERTRGFFRGVFNECMRGQVRLEDALTPYLSEWGWQGNLEEFISTWLREDHQVDELLANAIRSLRRQGYLCGLATLQERRRAEYMRSEMGFGELFDRLFFSCDLGYLKPEPQFFAKVEQQLGLPREAILFWDDKQENVEAARLHGWNAQIYKDFADFEKRIVNLL